MGHAALRACALVAATLAVAGCQSMSTWTMPTIPPPSFDWLASIFGGSSKALGPVPDFPAKASLEVAWQANVGPAGPGFAPAITRDAVYAASANGTVVRVDSGSGTVTWRIDAGKKLSAGVGADANVVVVGTDKGDVLAFDASGKALWQSKVSSEVLGPPHVAEGIVLVWTGDARIHALGATDGKAKWIYQRTNPPLTIRNYAGGTSSRGGAFAGTAGGKLVALDVATGNVGWEANVATPKGATELERIADVTSLPLVEEKQVCAVAFQGRVACFEILRGEPLWARDLSSLTGVAADNRFLFVADDKGAVHALDKVTGASAWTQDKLAPRRVGGAQVAGDYVAVGDPEGYVYLLDRGDGSLAGRAATDGTRATTQFAKQGERIVWQTVGGMLYSATGR